MAILRRFMAMLLCAALLAAPCGALAEEYVIPAGQVTTTAIADAYALGLQIDGTVDFGLAREGESERTDALASLFEEVGLELPNAAESERMGALASLLEKTRLTFSVYDDFGVVRLRGGATLDGVTLLDVDAQILEDGSVQLVTNLTGDAVLTVPAEALTKGVESLVHEKPDVALSDPAFALLSASDRLRLTLDDLGITLIDHLLGWVSYTQRERGDLYVFDTTYLEATDTRDAVAQRMVGTVRGWDFSQLFMNIMMTVTDDRGQFQQALADRLAELGVTRYQVRQVVDRLIPNETMDPAEDWVQPSATVYNDGALCKMDDIAYAVKKLAKRVDTILCYSNEEELKMIVSYDDYGDMVGLDLELPVFSSAVPYEGSFNYGIKHDAYDQADRSAHGELQLYDGYRLFGDLAMHSGVDVEGVNESGVSGYLDLHKDDKAIGLGVDARTAFRRDAGDDEEKYSSSLALSLRQTDASLPVVAASLNGATAVDEQGFELSAQAMAGMPGLASVTADIAVQSVEYDGEAFPSGTPVDVTDREALSALKQQILSQLMTVFVNVSARTGLMEDIMTVLGQ